MEISFVINIIPKIENQNIITSINANLGSFNPKNKTLHKILSIKLIPKTNATLLFCSLFFEFTQAKYREKVINKNKVFQTIGKTQFGGVIEGLIEEYHSVFVLFVVNKLPIPATSKNTISKQIIKTLIINNFILFKSVLHFCSPDYHTCALLLFLLFFSPFLKNNSNLQLFNKILIYNECI